MPGRPRMTDETVRALVLRACRLCLEAGSGLSYADLKLRGAKGDHRRVIPARDHLIASGTVIAPEGAVNPARRPKSRPSPRRTLAESRARRQLDRAANAMQLLHGVPLPPSAPSRPAPGQAAPAAPRERGDPIADAIRDGKAAMRRSGVWSSFAREPKGQAT